MCAAVVCISPQQEIGERYAPKDGEGDEFTETCDVQDFEDEIDAEYKALKAAANYEDLLQQYEEALKGMGESGEGIRAARRFKNNSKFQETVIKAFFGVTVMTENGCKNAMSALNGLI